MEDAKPEKQSEIILTLAALEGRLPGRLDGRPRRTKVLAHTIRNRFMEALDDDNRKVLVYITKEGTVRKDVKTVQEELAAAGEFNGIEDDSESEVDIDAVMAGKREKPANVDEVATDEESEDQSDEEDDEEEDAAQNKAEADDEDYVEGQEEEEEDEASSEDEVEEEEEEEEASETESEEEDDGEAAYRPGSSKKRKASSEVSRAKKQAVHQ